MMMGTYIIFIKNYNGEIKGDVSFFRKDRYRTEAYYYKNISDKNCPYRSCGQG